jgi:hypothetical protein
MDLLTNKLLQQTSAITQVLFKMKDGFITHAITINYFPHQCSVGLQAIVLITEAQTSHVFTILVL